MEQIDDGKYKCSKCGYVYDPEKGDQKQGIESETAFPDLPEGWKCPRCRKGKEEFRPV